MSENDEGWKDVAMEEWRQLQSIIGRHEGLEFQVRGWLLVLLGALVAALFADKPQLSPAIFFGIAWVLIITFGFMELMVRIPKREAIHRVGDVETALRLGRGYDGPAICSTLSQGPWTSEWQKLLKSEILVLGFSTFYVPLVVAVGIVALTSAGVRRSPPDRDAVHSSRDASVTPAATLDTMFAAVPAPAVRTRRPTTQEQASER